VRAGRGRAGTDCADPIVSRDARDDPDYLFRRRLVHDLCQHHLAIAAKTAQDLPDVLVLAERFGGAEMSPSLKDDKNFLEILQCSMLFRDQFAFTVGRKIFE